MICETYFFVLLMIPCILVSLLPQETAAAMRLQAAWRRTKAMNDIERSGQTTSAIRHRRLRREYRLQRKMNEKQSSLLACCGADLVMPEWNQDEHEALEAEIESEKVAYEEKKKAKLHREEELRNKYGRIMRNKKQNLDKLDEAYEVVEE
jgi:hypothetical protein